MTSPDLSLPLAPPARAATRGALRTPVRSQALLDRERWVMSFEGRLLVVLTAAILAFGLATLYSASSPTAMAKGLPSWHFLFRQLTGVAAGVVALMVASKVDVERFREWAWPMMVIALFTLLLTVLPFTHAISPEINGSRRFLLGGSLQPSEFGKLALVMWTAMLIVKKGGEAGLRRLSKGLFPFLIVLGALCGLAALEPDLSVVLFYGLVMMVMLFAAGARIGHFVVLGVAALPIVWNEVHRLEYVLRRILGFAGAAGAGEQVKHQLDQSLIAVGSGGLFGVGFGRGRQQSGFLPLSYNDFIGGSIGEEWGFVGLLGLILAYALWGLLGFRIAKQARTPFSQLVAIGLTVTMLVTAYLHLGVVIGLLPTTGLTLPFVSYGRSNVVLSLLMTGILLNIGSARERLIGEHASDPLHPRG